MAKRKVRIRYGRFLFSMVLLFIIGFILYRGASLAFSWMSRVSVLPETAQVSRSVSAFVLRDESRIYTQNGGTVRYFVEDGTRVQKGQKIAEITVNGTGPAIGAQGSQGILEIDRVQLAQLDSEIEKLMDAVAEGVRTGALAGVPGLKTDLALKLADKQRLESEIASLESGFQPEVGTVGSQGLKAGQEVEIRSPGTGIISFYSDGQEELFKPALYRSLQPEALTLKEPSGIAVPEIQAGALLYKLVDGGIWYLLAPVSPADGKMLTQTQGLKVRVGTESLEATVKDILQKDGQTLLLLELRAGIGDFHRQRFMKVELEMDQYQGLAVPNSSLVRIGESVGVMRIVAGKQAFVPVEVLSRLPDYTVVAEGVFYRSEGTQVKEIPTLKKGDYIIRKPENGGVDPAQGQE